MVWWLLLLLNIFLLLSYFELKLIHVSVGILCNHWHWYFSSTFVNCHLPYISSTFLKLKNSKKYRIIINIQAAILRIIQSIHFFEVPKRIKTWSTLISLLIWQCQRKRIMGNLINQVAKWTKTLTKLVTKLSIKKSKEQLLSHLNVSATIATSIWHQPWITEV